MKTDTVLHLDLYGRRLNEGDFVMRRRKGDPADPFQCHKASFGIIEHFVKETGLTRPMVKTVKPEDVWTEVCIRPFSVRMAKQGETQIQWTPAECFKIGWFGFLVLTVLWPITYLFHQAPLMGQPTDW